MERTEERNQMVARQIAARGVRDERVLAAMRAVPRHRFVPTHLQAEAYDDRALPISFEQTISQPYIVAFMTEALGLASTHRVLEVGTGSGYQSAVLAEIVAEVFTIEIVPELARRARTYQEAVGYRNVRYRIGDAYEGWPEHAPFDRVLLTAAPLSVPPPLVEQLADGGRIVAPLGRGTQELLLIEKDGRRLRERHLLPVRFVPMTGRARRDGTREPDNPSDF